MDVKTKIKNAVRYSLANNRFVADVVARTAGLLTRAMRETNVLMFHPGRCGSSVVGMLLNQHPKIKWGGEIFAQLKKKYGKNSWVWDNPHMMIKLRNNIHFSRVFGFEIKRKHFGDVNIDKKGIINITKEMNYDKYIILERKNYLCQIVSSKVAKKIGKWNVKKDIEPPKVRIDLKDKKGNSLLKRFRKKDKFYESLKNLLDKKRYLYISYESDIKKDPKKAFKKIIKYLGLREVSVKINSKKINKRPLEKRVSNFEEVKGVLDRTKYEWMVRGK